MAFKMKGSAFKLRNVATKSALKHTESIERGKSATHEDHHEGRADIKRQPGGLKKSPNEMKSPLEHKMTSKNSGENNPYTFSHNKRHADGKMDSEHNLIKKEERKEEIEKPKKEKAPLKLNLAGIDGVARRHNKKHATGYWDDDHKRK